MMETEKLVESLRKYTYWIGSSQPYSHDIHPPICDEAANTIESLQRELAQVTAERDAAVADLWHRDNCDICAWADECSRSCGFECLHCNSTECHCKTCFNESEWKWRGVREEQNGE